MSNLRNIQKLFRQLFPKGHAFLIPKGGMKEKFFAAQAIGEALAVDEARATLWTILPNNPFFTADDASDWERRLGMITSVGISLDDRKLAIIRKMNHPGDVVARQSRDYIEDSLRLAGFDVYVHENIPAQSPESFLTPQANIAQLGQNQLGQVNLGNPVSFYPTFFTFFQLGNFQLGEAQLGAVYFNNVIANSIDQSVDFGFYLGNNYKRTFIIGGAALGSFADVDVGRKDEFRQLILKLKPAQNLGYLLINYI